MTKKPTARFVLPTQFNDTRSESEEMRLLPTLAATRMVSFLQASSTIFSCILGQALPGPGRLFALSSSKRVGA